MPAVQVLWDVYVYRFGNGIGALATLAIPFISLHSTVIAHMASASRYSS